MEQIIDKLYDALFDAYTNETNSERKAMYDNTLTVLANLDVIVPGLAD